jgi:hypothetical protein
MLVKTEYMFTILLTSPKWSKNEYKNNSLRICEEIHLHGCPQDDIMILFIGVSSLVVSVGCPEFLSWAAFLL